ncbi:MAG: IclR family transcriptional regulator [Vulcanimicrobiaceae bacterium]
MSKNFAAVGQLLYELCEEPELGVRELNRRLGISLGMTQRIVASLVETGLVNCNPKTKQYALGPGTIRLSAAMKARQNTLFRSASDTLEQLAEETEETACLHGIVDDKRVILAQAEGPHNLSWRGKIGASYPVHAGAAAKAILAFLPEKDLTRLLRAAHFKKLRDTTPSTEDELRASLEEVRRDGLSVTFGEREEGAGGVAAPVLDENGYPAYSISVYGPEGRIRPRVDALKRTVRDTASRLSLQ